MKYRILLILVFLIGAIDLTSCERDAHDPDLQLSGDISEYIPPYAIDLQCIFTGGIRHLEIKPVIHFDMNYWGLRIDEVEYFIDNKYLGTKKVYDFTYKCYFSGTGEHTVKANLIISGETINTTTFTVSKTINIPK